MSVRSLQPQIKAIQQRYAGDQVFYLYTRGISLEFPSSNINAVNVDTCV